MSVLPAFSQNDYSVYAEWAVVPAAALVARPDTVDAVAGAALWMPYLTAYGALVEVCHVGAADALLINAASSSVGVVDRVFPLQEVVRAHEHLESNTHFGKIVMTAEP